MRAHTACADTRGKHHIPYMQIPKPTNMCWTALVTAADLRPGSQILPRISVSSHRRQVNVMSRNSTPFEMAPIAAARPPGSTGIGALRSIRNTARSAACGCKACSVWQGRCRSISCDAAAAWVSTSSTFRNRKSIQPQHSLRQQRPCCMRAVADEAGHTCRLMRVLGSADGGKRAPGRGRAPRRQVSAPQLLRVLVVQHPVGAAEVLLRSRALVQQCLQCNIRFLQPSTQCQDQSDV